MRFENSEYLYLLLLIPLVLAIYIISNKIRQRRLNKFGDKELVEGLMPDVSAYRPGVKFILAMVALAFMIIALARPRYGKANVDVTTKGIEMVVVMDVSNSMRAGDIFPNRLEKAKRLAGNLFEKLGNHKMGLVLFAGTAYQHLPLTTDLASARMLLEGVTTDIIPNQGTDMGAAINVAIRSFSDDKEVGKAIVFITDSEDHQGEALEAAKRAAEMGINIYVLGIGTEKGAPIPLRGRPSEFHKDRNGNVVVSKLDESIGKTLAQNGKGVYLRVDNTNKAEKAIEVELDKLKKTEIKHYDYSGYNDIYHYFLWVAFVLLIIDMIILPGKSKYTRNLEIFSKQKKTKQ